MLLLQGWDELWTRSSLTCTHLAAGEGTDPLGKWSGQSRALSLPVLIRPVSLPCISAN